MNDPFLLRIATLFSLLVANGAFAALPLAATPPMGWNSWNQFGCDINESLIRETADAMVERGLKSAGYDHVIIDDCWQAANRSSSGELQADPARFPSGIKALADYVHARGLKFGIYTSVGNVTCQGRPGSQGHEWQDAKLFASWGVDYVKDDFCHRPSKLWPFTWWPWWKYRPHYEAMSAALRAADRPIVLGLCNWGWSHVWEWAGSIAESWRTTMDISPHWSSVMSILDQQIGKERYAGPGHWNDPDMLEVGVHPLTETESRAHFSLWAILAAPLIAGNDLRNMPDSIQRILTAPEVLAVDQDPAGIQGTLVSSRARLQVWARPLAGTRVGDARERAVVLLNRRRSPKKITVRFSALGMTAASATIRDLWERTDLGIFQDSYTAVVPPHGAVMVKITPSY